jgi:hypothetical protein
VWTVDEDGNEGRSLKCRVSNVERQVSKVVLVECVAAVLDFNSTRDTRNSSLQKYGLSLLIEEHPERVASERCAVRQEQQVD